MSRSSEMSWNVATSLPDHESELAFIVEGGRIVRTMKIVERTVRGGRLLVEDHRVRWRFHAGLGDVIRVVQTDGKNLGRTRNRRFEPNSVDLDAWRDLADLLRPGEDSVSPFEE